MWLGYYRAWGELFNEKLVVDELDNLKVSASDFQPIRFQGQFFDSETGLHYNRFRYYDSDVGMFIQRDPIGLMGGSNVFAYAPNPVQWIDPLGLAVVQAITRTRIRPTKRLCDALSKLTQYPNDPWIKAEYFSFSELTDEQRLLQQAGVAYNIDGFDMQYVLVQHRYNRSQGAIIGKVGAVGQSTYSTIFSGVSAINDERIKWGDKWGVYAQDTKNESRAITLGEKLGNAPSFKDGVKSFCGNLCTSC